MAWIVRENRARELLQSIRLPRPRTHETRPDVCFNPKTIELPRGSEMTRWARRRHSLVHEYEELLQGGPSVFPYEFFV
jgi:hypothetical protein